MNSNKAFIRIVALTAIVVIGGGAFAYAMVSKSNSNSTSGTTGSAATGSTQTAQQPTPTQQTQSAQTVPTSVYKDGTYSATGSYQSPGGDEKIGVTVTLKNDVITSSSVTPEPVSPDGRRFQQIFAQNYKQYVVGKDISSVHLTDVSGSSLTPIGFNDALTQIEAKAKNS